MASGDLICQTAVEKNNVQNVKLVRVLRFALLGTCFVGPALNVWYLQLERICGKAGSLVGLKKMLLDQIVFVPFFIGSFLSLSGFLQKQQWIDIKDKIHEDFFTILKSNYMIWPAAQLLNFYIIPFQYRILFVNSIALFWNVYLASKANTT